MSSKALLATFHVGFLLGLFSDPEDEMTFSSETSVDFQWTIQHYIPNGRTLQCYK
jgi:hypothetical protein